MGFGHGGRSHNVKVTFVTDDAQGSAVQETAAESQSVFSLFYLLSTLASLCKVLLEINKVYINRSIPKSSEEKQAAGFLQEQPSVWRAHTSHSERMGHMTSGRSGGSDIAAGRP